MNTPVIVAQDIRKTFNKTVALDAISFSIDKGQIFGFLGPSGSGKTTTINILTGQLTADSGRSSILAEEKEKNNLKTLLLSGVNTSEYLLSTLAAPAVLSAIYLIIAPLILDVPIDHLPNYCIIGSATALAIVLLYLLLGLLVKSQVMAQVVTVPTMLITAFLPMLSSMDKTVAKVTDYSFMGLFTKFFTKWEDFSWHSAILQTSSLIVWILVLLVLIVLAARQQKKS